MTITVVSRRQRGWLWWKRTEESRRTYEGSCTVWHDVETGERPGAHLEGRMADYAWLMLRRGVSEGQMTV